MTTTDTRRPRWRRTWIRVTASIAALALGAAVGAASAALAIPHAAIRPAANTAPAHPKAPKAAPRPARSTPPPPPAANGARPAPDKYAQDILNAGITAPVSWIDQTGKTLTADWASGKSVAWTDANVLGPGGVYSYHYGIFDQITEQDFGVYPPPAYDGPAPVTLNGVNEPSKIGFSGDGGNVAVNLVWSEWDSTQAVGDGTVNYQGCVPGCAQGTETPYPVHIVLSDLGPRSRTHPDTLAGDKGPR
jgi:hypothetical protein